MICELENKISLAVIFQDIVLTNITPKVFLKVLIFWVLRNPVFYLEKKYHKWKEKKKKKEKIQTAINILRPLKYFTQNERA